MEPTPPPADPATAAAPAWLPVAETTGQPAPVPPRRRRGRAAVVGVVVLLAVLVLAVLVGEWATRSAEADALLDRIERSEAAMITAMGAVSTTMQQDDSYDGGLSDGAADQLRAAADAAHREVILAADSMNSIAIQPWHRETLQVREAYLEHSAAWRDFLARAELEPSGWFVEDPSIATTWEAFIEVLPAIVPTPALPGLEARVAAILDEGAGGEGEPDPGDTLQALAARS